MGRNPQEIRSGKFVISDSMVGDSEQMRVLTLTVSRHITLLPNSGEAKARLGRLSASWIVGRP